MSDTNPLPSFYESRRRYWGNAYGEMSSDDSLEDPPTDAAYASDTAPVADDTATVADDLALDDSAVRLTAVVEHAVDHTVDHTIEHTAEHTHQKQHHAPYSLVFLLNGTF